jgi:hypothetical protein
MEELKPPTMSKEKHLTMFCKSHRISKRKVLKLMAEGKVWFCLTDTGECWGIAEEIDQ